MPTYSFNDFPVMSFTTNGFSLANPSAEIPLPAPYPRVDQIGSPRDGYFVVEADDQNGYLIPEELRSLTVDYIRSQQSRNGINGGIDWVNYVDHLTVILGVDIFLRSWDGGDNFNLERWEVPAYIRTRILTEYDGDNALEEIGLPNVVRNAAGQIVASFTEATDRAVESTRAMAERVARITEQLQAVEEISRATWTPAQTLTASMVDEILDGPVEAPLQDWERELAQPSPLTIIRRRRRMLESIGDPWFTWETIPAILNGPADRRNPTVRRYIDDLAADAVRECSCLPCLLVYREITFHEYLDRRWAADFGDESVEPIAITPSPTQARITFDDLLGDPWNRPRVARPRRAEPTRLNWRPTREEEQHYFREDYDRVTGNYIEPRYQRYDRQGNEVLPGPATRNNRLPAHHPAVAERGPRDAWYSEENIRVRNDQSDRSNDYDEDDEDYDFESGRYSQGEPYGIMPWDYKPREFHFYGERHNDHTPYFGFELEINSNYPNAEIVNNVPGLYTKWDGSIDGGFEIVSMPMTWEYLTNDFNFDWVPQLRDAGAKAGRNGLHVHVSRSGFANDFHAWRWIKLWSDADNYAAVRTFNRRQNLGYATPLDRETPYRKARGLGIGDGSRYVMLNAQNHATFELRGPASTLNRFKLKGTLAVVAATVEYTRQKMTSQQIALGALEWRAFLEWTLEQPAYAEYVRKYLSILLEEGAPEAVYPAYLRETNGA